MLPSVAIVLERDYNRPSGGPCRRNRPSLIVRSAMLRIVAFGFALVICAGAASAQDADPVRDKLFAAKRAHDAEQKSIREQAEAWFDKREQAAQKMGDTKAADLVRAERVAFDDGGELPKSAPASIKTQQERALKALEVAYAQALKEYTVAKRSDDAEAAETELRNIRSRLYAVDLLALVNPKTHRLSGEWVKTAAGLATTSSANDHSRLHLPYEPGEEYDVEIKCKRLVGTDTFGLGLPIAGGFRVIAVLDSWPSRGHASGLQLVDGKEPVNGNPTTVKGRVMLDDQWYTLLYSVRSNRVEMAVDGKPLFSFRGEASRLSAFNNYVSPNHKALFLFVAWHKTGVQIKSITVFPIKGKGMILK